jgi:DNA-binding NarL/FixJ family response regulator
VNSVTDPFPVDDHTGHRWRLLIADDDPAVSAVLSSSLGEEFDIVAIAGNGQEAVALADSTQPDVALIDVEMPEGGGVVAVRGIIDVAPATAIVILSSHESEADVQELLSAGAVASCRKGISPTLIARSLRDSIELWRELTLPDDIEVVAELDYLERGSASRSQDVLLEDW